MPFPLTGGATLAEVAAHAKAHRYSPAIKVAEHWATQDHIAMDWILQAAEAGYDVGRPRDKRKRRV